MSTLSSTRTAASFDVEKIREDFPVLKQKVHGKPLVYLDSAATAQKPHAVIDAIRRFHEVDCANIHRGVHELSQRSTAAYEETRAKAKRFLNARSKDELIFVRGTTEGINLVTSSWGRRNVKEGDEIIISAMEHHSNIVPWQMLCLETGAKLRVIPMNERGELLWRSTRSCSIRAPGWSPSPTSPTRSAPSTRSARSSKWRTTPAR